MLACMSTEHQEPGELEALRRRVDELERRHDAIHGAYTELLLRYDAIRQELADDAAEIRQGTDAIRRLTRSFDRMNELAARMGRAVFGERAEAEVRDIRDRLHGNEGNDE
jgi:uncharacterized coiled-coil DUF342 family protein